MPGDSVIQDVAQIGREIARWRVRGERWVLLLLDDKGSSFAVEAQDQGGTLHATGAPIDVNQAHAVAQAVLSGRTLTGSATQTLRVLAIGLLGMTALADLITNGGEEDGHER